MAKKKKETGQKLASKISPEKKNWQSKKIKEKRPKSGKFKKPKKWLKKKLAYSDKRKTGKKLANRGKIQNPPGKPSVSDLTG